MSIWSLMKKLVAMLGLFALLLVVLPGPLHKWQLLSLSSAYTAMQFGLYVGIATVVLLLTQFIFMRSTVQRVSAVVSGVCAAIAITIVLSLITQVKGVPPINDVSTDVVMPPKFVAVAALRADSPNSVEYAGIETAALQLKAYPELKTLRYKNNTNTVFVTILDVIEQLDWQLVHADANIGIVEATDTSAWFGFEDDVVIRIKSKPAGTFVDIRSKSRVGKSDFGSNAARIKQFIALLEQKLRPI